MFPGQGAQYVGMARGLYQRLPAFRSELDRCAKILSAENIDLIGALYGPQDTSMAERLARTDTAQPAIFSVSYALARQWQSWGVNAQAYLGHSVGEFVAACLAGVFSLHGCAPSHRRARATDASSSRGRHAQRPSVGGRGQRFWSAMGSRSRRSTARQTSSSRDLHEALQAIVRQLEARGTACRRLHTSHAFHSPMMDPMIGPFTRARWRASLCANPRRRMSRA